MIPAGRKTIVVVAALLLGAATAAAASSAVRWRAALVAAKLRGQTPAAIFDWTDLLLVMRPPSGGGKLSYLKAMERHVEAAGTGAEPCPVYWKTPLGGFWGRSDERYVLSFLMLEQLVSHIYQREPVTIRPGDVVLDVGGHLGTFTRAALLAGARRVVAFEPEPTNAACFQRSFEQDIADGRVVLVEAAVWESPGSLLLAPRMNDAASSVVPGIEGVNTAKTGVTVPATTIDATVERLALDRVDFIKMDIEGAERHAVRGAGETLRRFAPRLVLCVYHRPDDPVAVPAAVRNARPQYQSFRTPEQVYFY